MGTGLINAIRELNKTKGLENRQFSHTYGT